MIEAPMAMSPLGPWPFMPGFPPMNFMFLCPSMKGSPWRMPPIMLDATAFLRHEFLLYAWFMNIARNMPSTCNVPHPTPPSPSRDQRCD